MRLVVIALTILMLASSSMAIHVKTLVANNMLQEKEGEHSNGNNNEHQIPLNRYSDIHEIPGTGGPGERTVSGHMEYTKPASPNRNG
ncbi:hypothetical protein HKD37_11G031692 [Glycine soja]|nr:hypothetical protein GmHk_11G032307 [Glycine max]